MKVLQIYNGETTCITDPKGLLSSKKFYRVMVGGGRDFYGKDARNLLIKTLVNALEERRELIGQRPVIIVQGGANGVDRVAKELAVELELICEEFQADWNNIDVEGAVIKVNKYGKQYNALAGFKRNQEMIDVADLVVLLHDGVSHGTKDDYNRAIKANKDLVYVKY